MKVTLNLKMAMRKGYAGLGHAAEFHLAEVTKNQSVPRNVKEGGEVP